MQIRACVSVLLSQSDKSFVPVKNCACAALVDIIVTMPNPAKVSSRIVFLFALGWERLGEVGELSTYTRLTRPRLCLGHPLPPMGGEGI